MIKVLIADDHPAMQEGLSKLLSNAADIQVIGSASDGEEAVRLAEQMSPDVAMLDVAMPKLDGIQAAKKIKELSPKTAVIMISAFDYESYLLGSVSAGAAGYLLKNCTPGELINAIRLVYSGEAVFHFGSVGNIFRLATNKAKPVEQLQKRELDVLKLAAKGLGNKEIARVLGISQHTVHSHMLHIFGKLGVGSRTQAVIHALKEGWVTREDLL